MALIGSIRKNGWVLIVLMTLALGGFILMEIISNAQRNSAGDVNTLGKVNGVEVKRSDFEDYEKLIFGNSQNNPYQNRSQIWNYFVEKNLVNELAEGIGLNVGSEELEDLQFGNNISPIVAERFKDETGQPNRAQLNNIKQMIANEQFNDPQNRAFWRIQEQEIQKERLQSKINALVAKAVFAPAWQAEMSFRESNERLNYLYVRVPFDRVPDTEIQVTDADYKAFLKDNPGVYDQQEETRTIQFVVFDVLPAGEDSIRAYEEINKQVEAFRNAENDSIFISNNNGQLDPAYTPKANLPPSVADSMVRLPLGAVVGPFFENGVWNLAKIIDRKVVPDSVKARHILIQGKTPAAEAKIDSLQALLESGKARFDSLAAQNSDDQGSAIKGGDLGFFPQGVMVAEFNEVCFYKAEKGKYYKVATQFGWHLIEVTDKKLLTSDPAVKVGYLTSRIEPSRSTQDAFKEKAIALIESADNAEEMAKKAAEKGLQVQSSTPLRVNDFAVGALGRGEEAREVVRWAFDKKTAQGNIGKEVFAFRDANGGYFDSKYVVAALSAITPAGQATVEGIKNNTSVVQQVKNRKKGEIISGKLQGVNDLQTAANQYTVTIDSSLNVTFLQPVVQNGGLEPKVVGTAFGAPKGAVKGPIVGNTGVYFVQPISDKTQAQLPGDITIFRKQAQSTMAGNLRIGFMNALKKAADVKDMRNKFF